MNKVHIIIDDKELHPYDTVETVGSEHEDIYIILNGKELAKAVAKYQKEKPRK